jgi:hypothetical protein
MNWLIPSFTMLVLALAMDFFGKPHETTNLPSALSLPEH